jgi:hypothetical protein
MAALSTLAVVGASLVASKFLKPKTDTSAIQPPPLIAPPDTAKMQRQAAESAQQAAALTRLRGNTPSTNGGTLLTGPAGIPQPAPVARKTLLGQ